MASKIMTPAAEGFASYAAVLSFIAVDGSVLKTEKVATCRFASKSEKVA
jgi:hypothetical protein